MSSYEELEKAIQLYGDAETKTLGLATCKYPLVWISDPKLLKEFYITKANLFEKPDIELVKYFGEENILTAVNNDRWKRHFKICSLAFTPRTLMYTCKVAVESCDCLFENWNAKLENGPFVLNVDDYSNLTLDVLGKAGFNLDFGIFSENRKGKQFRHAMEKILSATAIVLLLTFGKNTFLFSFFSKLLGIESANDYCSKYLDEIIEERKQLLKNETFESDKTSDILSLLVDANVKEESITNNELKSNALILSVAGHETTAKSLVFICYRLSKNLELQRRLWEEVDTVLQGRNPTYDDVQSLPFVNALMLESLRMNSPVNDLTRIATKNATLGKFEIPKGTHVHAMISYVQRREDIWENANEFNPDRFLNPHIRDNYSHNFTFASFSLGNRQCLGKNFALLEACMVLSKLAQNYEFKLLNDEKTDPIGLVQLPVVKPTSNLKIQVSRRSTKMDQ